MPPKLLIPAVLIVAVVIAAGAVFALSGGGGDDGDGDTALASPTVPGTIVPTFTPTPPPSATPTLETAPEITPTPELSPEEQARNLTLVEAPAGMLEFVTDGPYVVPGDALGVFYIDIETQQIEGWYDLLGGTQPVAFSGENRFTLFHRDEQVFVAGTIYPAGHYLGDRESRKVYRVPDHVELVFEKGEFNGNEITARGDLVLFRVPVSSGNDWFTLLDLANGEVTQTFHAEGHWALISRDASKVAVVGTGVEIVDVASGEVETVGTVMADTGHTLIDNPGAIELTEAAAGESWVFVAGSLRPEEDSLWLRYTWEGELEAEGTGAKIYLSPDGSLVAVAERIPSDHPTAPWHALNALNTSDGSPVFRVVGVDEQYAWPNGNRWLADGSGIIVQLANNGILLAMRDGGFRDYVGSPSPESPEVFDIGGGVADGEGNPVFQLSFQGGVRDFVDGWGDTGDEVRILIPHGGHGGPPATATIVEPYVEEAPYDAEPQLQLSDVAVAFGLFDLYDEPGGDTVVGQVAAPYRVTVEEVANRCSGDGYSDPQQCPLTDSRAPHEFMALVLGFEIAPEAPLTSYWARVTTPDGQQGWLLLQANYQGI